MLTQIEAEVDVNGSVVLLEPIHLERKSRAIVTIIDFDDADERQEWLRFSAANLERAYGDGEPDYALAALKEINPDYERR